MPTWCRHLALRRLRNFCDDHARTGFFAWKCRLNRRMLRQRDDRLANLGSHRDRCMARRVFPRRRRRGTMVRCGVCCPRAQLPSTPVVEDSWESRVNGRGSFISANACDSRYSVGTIADLFSTSERRPGKPHRSGARDGSIQFQSAGLNLVLLTPLWTGTAHVVPLRMVRRRFTKLRYG